MKKNTKMNQDIINQCKSAGGRIEKDRCVFTTAKKSSSAMPKFDWQIGKFNLKQIALWTFIVTIVFAGFLGILALLGQWGETQMRILFSTMIVGGYGLLMITTFALFAKRSTLITGLLTSSFSTGAIISVLKIWELEPLNFAESWATIGIFTVLGLIAIAANTLRKKSQIASYIAIGVTALAFLSCMNLVWDWGIFKEVHNSWFLFGNYNKDYMKITWDLLILSIFGGHAALMMLIAPKKQSVTTMQWLTIIFAGLTVITLMAIIHMQPENMDMWFRIIGIIGIVNVASTIITPVLNRTG